MEQVQKMIFTPADIALPPYRSQEKDWQTWAVIACDQFTSEPQYWQNAEKLVGEKRSTYRLMLPEAYLGTEKETGHQGQIGASMKDCEQWLQVYPDTLIYLERTLPDGKLRRGLLGKIDLEAYDYHTGSVSPVRATEATVLERIPPRCAIREQALYEMPHVMAFYTDPADEILRPIFQGNAALNCLYQTELMLGGGAITGYAVEGKTREAVMAALAAYEAARSVNHGVVYAIGDGNHSLAAARAHYGNLKEQLGDAALRHPARYALLELVRLEEESIEFEPIYRVMMHCNTEDLYTELQKITTDAIMKDANAIMKDTDAGSTENQRISMVTAEGEMCLAFTQKSHALTVGTLQNFLDAYLKAHPKVVCDYIHGEEVLRELAEKPESMGFILEGMAKDSLFPYVEQNGVLPRKTFSMGEARSKRYYLELRKIQ